VITSRWCQTTRAPTWPIRPRLTLTRTGGNMKKMCTTYGCFQVEEERLHQRLLLPRRRRLQLQLQLLLAPLRQLPPVRHQQLLPDRHRRQGLRRRREPVPRRRRGRRAEIRPCPAARGCSHGAACRAEVRRGRVSPCWDQRDQRHDTARRLQQKSKCQFRCRTLTKYCRRGHGSRLREGGG
jgi:hypothetical protein